MCVSPWRHYRVYNFNQEETPGNTQNTKLYYAAGLEMPQNPPGTMGGLGIFA